VAHMSHIRRVAAASTAVQAVHGSAVTVWRRFDAYDPGPGAPAISGAAGGAAIGSVVGPVGTYVGAAIGSGLCLAIDLKGRRDRRAASRSSEVSGVN